MSASLNLGVGGAKKAATGGMLKLGGSNGDLDFTEFKGDITGSWGPQVPGSLKQTWNLDFSLSAVSAGGGAMWTTGEVTPPYAPEVTKTAKAQTRTFVYVLQDFPVESSKREIPSSMITSINSDLSQLEDRVLEDADGLREFGIEQSDFKVAFTCEGFASRGWAAAVSETIRKQKNVELSAKRAQYVSDALMEKFGDIGESYSAIGRGPALLAPESSKLRAADVVAEEDTEGIDRLVERHRLKWLDDQMRREAGLPDGAQKRSPEQLDTESREEADRFRESLMKSNPETATAPGAQRVNITISWKGQLLEYGTEAGGTAPGPVPVP